MVLIVVSNIEYFCKIYKYKSEWSDSLNSFVWHVNIRYIIFNIYI